MHTKYNYYNLINLKPKFQFLINIILILTILSLFVSIKVKIFSQKSFYAIYLDGYLYINVDINNSDIINQGKYLKLDDNKFEYKITQISELQLDEINSINYQTYQIPFDKHLINNEVRQITIYYDNNYLYKKIWQLIS